MKLFFHLLSYILKSLVLLGLTIAISLSFLQQKFPPSFQEVRRSYQDYHKMIEVTKNMSLSAENSKNLTDSEIIDSLINEKTKAQAVKLLPDRFKKESQEPQLAKLVLEVESLKKRMKYLEWEIQNIKNNHSN